MARSTARRFAPFAAAAVLALPAVAQFVAAVASAPPAAASVATAAVPAQQGTQTFQGDFNHMTGTFTVPPAVTQVRFVAQGGHGGHGGANAFTVGGMGGYAAVVSGTVNVTPGQTFDLYLGEAGGDASDNAFQLGSPGAGGGLSRDDNHGGFGGQGDGNSGGGGGGGAATTVSTNGVLLALAGGGGGGGGAGGVANYVGGPGGIAGPGLTGGTGGTGPGAGSGGGILSCAAAGGHAGATGRAANSSSTGGGGGGGGAGYNSINCGGDGGFGGGTGGGGGGGGGAGASYYDTSRVTSPDLETAGTLTDGRVTFAWNLPQSSVNVTATSYASTLRLVAHVSPQGVQTPTPTGTVDFSETPDGTSESPLGSATVDAQGNATLVTSNAYGGTNSFIARYRGDDTYSASSSFVAYTYPPTSVTPTVTGAADQNPAPWNTQGKLTATVVAPSTAPAWAPVPTGTVKFSDITGGAAHQYSDTQSLAADGTASSAITWSATGTYTFEIDYSGDANYAATSTTFTVVANASPPVAVVGPDKTSTSGAIITIDGSASTDPQGSPLSYDWQQVDGPAAMITEERHSATTVRLPTTNTKVVVHLRLTVTNGAGLSSSSILGITVNPK